MKNSEDLFINHSLNRQSEQPITRYYFLDACRMLLMIAGIPYHLSLMYMPESWSTGDPQVFTHFSVLLAINHSFRMSCFFFIAGFFSYMLISRELNPTNWLKKRILRLGIPFATGFIFINLPQILYIKEHNGDFNNSTNLSLIKRINEVVGPSIGHLWFLIVLLILSVIFTYIYTYIKNNYNSPDMLIRIITLLSKKNGLIFFAISTSLFGLAYNAIIYFAELILPSFNRYDGLFFILVWGPLKYFPFYLLGILNSALSRIFSLFLRFSWLHLFLAVLFISGYVITSIVEASFFIKTLRVIFWNCSGIFASSFLLSCLNLFLNNRSALIKLLVDSSLVIYIVHPLIIQIIFTYFQGYLNNKYFEFIVECLAVYSLSLLIYFLIQRIYLLRFLFSGKLKP